MGGGCETSHSKRDARAAVNTGAWVARAGGRGRGGASVGEAMCGRLAYLLWSTARSRWCCRCGSKNGMVGSSVKQVSSVM